MPFFVATFRYSPQSDRLAAARPERHEYFRVLEDRGVLLASGQLLDGNLGDGMLVLKAADEAAVLAMLDDDPFARRGLVEQRSVARWHVTVGTHSSR